MITLVLVALIVAFATYKYLQLFKGFESLESSFDGPKRLPILGNAMWFIGDATGKGYKHKCFFKFIIGVLC